MKLQELTLEHIETASLEQLLAWATEANDFYRRGEPVILDPVYDVIVERIKRLDPNNSYVESVEEEPEEVFGKTVPLPARMLSTDKAYTLDRIQAWADRVVKEAAEIGVGPQDLKFRMTPKLDGFAAYADGEKLYTRGNGRQGSDISHVLGRGLQSLFDGAVGPGEIIVDIRFFEKHLSGAYENTRNVVAAAIKEGELDPLIQKGLTERAILFIPFSYLLGWEGSLEMLNDVEAYRARVNAGKVWEIDGIVIEVTNENVKAHMGSTNHHHRWQIAYKENTEFHNVPVLGLSWQTAKTGRITPVVLLEPTRISGVTVSRATGHHYGNVMSKHIGKGAVVKVCRSGQVIPYIVDVVEPGDAWGPPECPSCGAMTEPRGDNLFCTNTVNCPAQIERTIYHFFDTIGNCDGFGPQTISMLCADLGDTPPVANVLSIYQMSISDFESRGFGERTAHNLLNELGASLSRPIEDWRFLAAFGIDNVGKGGCERLLKHHALRDVFDLSIEDLVKIDGFGEKTAQSLRSSLIRIRPEFESLVDQFTLLETPRGGTVVSPISGMTVVFTGTMQQGSRDDMEAQAKRLGANVSGSVSSRTTYLVCGANVGANKTAAAEKHGVTVLTEQAYLTLIGATS